MADQGANSNPAEPAKVFSGRSVHPVLIPVLSIVTAYAIYVYIWLYRRYAEIRHADPASTRVSPALAVALCLVPGVNIVGVFYVFFDLARALGRLQRKYLGRCLLWPYSVPILTFVVPTLAGIVVAFIEPSLAARLRMVLPVTVFCQWCGMVIAQASLNRVWSAGQTPTVPAKGAAPDPLWRHYRRQMFGSLACVLPILVGFALVVRQAVRIGDFLPARGIRLGLTLAPPSGAQASNANVESAIKRIRLLLKASGDRWPVVRKSTAPGELIEVVVPASADPHRVRDLLQFEGWLELREVMGDSFPTEAGALASAGGKIPEDSEILQARGPNAEFYICKHRALFDGEDLQSARVENDSYGQPAIVIKLTESAGERMGTYSANNIGRRVAIVFDGRVTSAPVIQGTFGRDIQIAGRFSPEEAQDLALVLRAGTGARRQPARVLNEQITPTAHWVVRQSTFAGILALAYVAMVFLFYRIVPGRYTNASAV